MKIVVRKKVVHYRKWGVPETKIRASIYLDDTFIGSIMALPEKVEAFLTLISNGLGMDNPENSYDEHNEP